MQTQSCLVTPLPKSDPQRADINNSKPVRHSRWAVSPSIIQRTRWCLETNTLKSNTTCFTISQELIGCVWQHFIWKISPEIVLYWKLWAVVYFINTVVNGNHENCKMINVTMLTFWFSRLLHVWLSKKNFKQTFNRYKNKIRSIEVFDFFFEVVFFMRKFIFMENMWLP